MVSNWKCRPLAWLVPRAPFVAALLCIANLASAQDQNERINALERRLEESMRLIDQLSARVIELEGRGAKQQASADAQPDRATDPKLGQQEERIQALERGVAQMTEAASRVDANSGLPLHGFADVGYLYSNKEQADSRRSGFVVGNLDFYLNPEFDRVKTLAELVFEYDEAGDLAVDLERAQIGYTFSDALTLWAGRFHTPYGYWNTGFHHGAQIQTSVLRPKFIGFEDQGGILPAHSVGLWGAGYVPLGAGKLTYDAYLANGNRVVDNELEFNAFKDDNGNKLVGGNVGYRFGGALDGLLIGAHAFTERVGSVTAGAPSGETKVNMLGGYAFLDKDNWEGIAEYYRFYDKNLGDDSRSHNSWAGFVQLGRNFAGRVTPYARVEKAALDQADGFFGGLTFGKSYERLALGLRYDLNPKAAIKFEANRTDETKDGGQKYSEGRLQFAIRF